jgi:hypothetical protein
MKSGRIIGTVASGERGDGEKECANRITTQQQAAMEGRLREVAPNAAQAALAAFNTKSPE